MPWFPLHGVIDLHLALLFFLFASNLAATTKGDYKKEDRVAVLATADLPAKSLDLAAMNLTELVNGMLNTALKGTNKFFSLLSITSYSSYAFHKVSIVIYNISNLKNVDPTKFPMRYCYCLNNRTNDLTDFTALLVDIVGNTTSYLTELFKSTSIVSVSQSSDTDCVYICVMSGHTGRNLSDLWEAIEKSPVINYTFSGNVSDLLDLNFIPTGWKPLQEDADKVLSDTAKGTWTFKTTKMPVWPQNGPLKGKEMLLIHRPIFVETASLKGSEIPLAQLPLWLQTTALKGYVLPSSEATSASPVPAKPLPAPAESYESPPGAPTTLTSKKPEKTWTIARKGNETTSPHFTMWPKTSGLKGSEVSSFLVSSWLHTAAPKDWKVSLIPMAPSPTPLASYGIPSGTQPVPTTGVPVPLASPSTEQGQDALKTDSPSLEDYTFLTRPVSSKITKPPHQKQTVAGNVPSPALLTSPQKPGVLQKVHSRCPQATKKGSSMTTPPIPVQRINPCVMELCKFYQLCLCSRDRSYSREEAMRFCIENYSWFLKNAVYVCEKVKRTVYSKTLKQKCLASICKSI